MSSKFLYTVQNDEVLMDLKFPSELKLADFVPAFKKEDSTLVGNYRQISILLPPRVLRELWLIKLPLKLTLKLLSSLIEKWKQIMVNKDNGAAILMDFSKAFDTIIMNF